MRKSTLLLLALTIVLVGCKAGADGAVQCGPAPQIPYSDELAQSLDRRLLPYLQGQTGRFFLQTTSQELTSWIAYSVTRWPGIPIQDAAVWFSPQRVHVSGIVTRVLLFSVPFQAHARVWLDGGALQVSVEEACVGRVAFPRWARDFVSDVITETIMDTGPYVRLDTLEIGDGYLRASGWLGH